MPIRYLSGLSVDSTVLVVDAVNDRVGIGTSAPGAKLDINAASSSPIVRVAGGGDGSGGGKGNIRSSDQGGTNYWDFGRDNLTTGNFVITPPSGNSSLSITIGGNVGIGTTAPTATLDARISGITSGAVIKVGNVGSGDFGGLAVSDGGTYPVQLYGSSLAFLTGNSAYASATEKMRITSAGNVGIGTTNPLARLNVWTAATTGLQTALRLNNPFGFDNLNTGAKIVFSQDRSTAEDIPMGELGVGQADAATSANGYMFFSTKSTTMGERLRITSGGNVLINTTTDSGFKLDVNGTARVGALTGTSAAFSSSVAVNGTAPASSGLLTVLTSTSTIGATAGLGLLISNDGAAGKMSQIGFGYSETTSAAVIGGIITSSGGATASALFFATRNTTVGSDSPIERMRITAAGDVGIGTTAPQVVGAAWTTLEVKGKDTGGGGIIYATNAAGTVSSHYFSDGSGGYIGTQTNQFFALTTNNAERMRITSGGNIYINSTSMDGKLGINSATSVAYNPNAFNGVNASIRLTNGSAGVNRYTGIAFGGGGSTEAFIGSVQNANELAEIVFQTFNGSSYGEKARITSGGNVLIGTTTDGGYKLRVNGTGRYDGNLQLWAGDGGASPRLIFGGETSNTDKSIFLETYYMVFQGHNNEGFKFQTTSPAAVVSNRMSILGTGTIVLSNYGTGTKTGTPAFNLAVDSSGNIIETAGGVVDGSGTANFVTKWQDANTVTNSIIRDDGTTVGVGTAPAAAKLTVDGSITAGGQTNYGKSYGSIDTTGQAVAGLIASTNGQGSMFTFTCRGGGGEYQRVVYSCYNDGGTWYTNKVIDEGTNALDVTASANGATITFTFKARSTTQAYTPAVLVQQFGSAIDTSYL